MVRPVTEIAHSLAPNSALLFYHCNNIPWLRHLMEGGFIWAHGPRRIKTHHHPDGEAGMEQQAGDSRLKLQA